LVNIIIDDDLAWVLFCCWENIILMMI